MIRKAPRDPRAIIQRLRASLDDRASDYAVTPAFRERVRRLRRRRRLARDATAALVITTVIAFAAVFTINALQPSERIGFVSPPRVSPSPTATDDAAQPSPSGSQLPSEAPASAPPTSSEAPSAPQTAPAGPRLTHDTAISLRGIGPVHAGMTLAEAERAAGVDFVAQHFEAVGGLCYFAYAEGLQEDFLLLLESPGSEPVDDPEDGIIKRVSATSDMASPAQTLSGIGVGASEEDVYRTYPGQIKSEPHVYIEGGHYLTYIPRDPQDQGYRVRFFTDGRVVQEIHAGDARVSGYVEGCA
jgi:hypothetical protein